MDIRLYTDKEYIPLSDLKVLGNEFVSKTEEYRKNFMELITLDGFNIVNIVETPHLIKKRFIKNVDLKGKILIDAENNDFILEVAKLIASGKQIPEIQINELDSILKKFNQNEKDLTIITEYITKNFNKIFLLSKNTNFEYSSSSIQLDHIFPQLSKNEIDFIKNFNDLNLNYSIHHFQNLTHCSYETGRKSLEKLEYLDFYKKNKIGKKFVYKPTEKLNLIIRKEKEK